MTAEFTPSNYSFLQGGGEMGALARAFDWSKTSLGTPDIWPQSLRTTLSILLNSRFPMFLFWGEELICFYNDAYRPSLGNEGKHPTALGQRGEECWPEIWPVIKPLIDQVKHDGEATWAQDQLIPIYRNGRLEDVYWTFSYSPVKDEAGDICGVLVVCSETTEQIAATRKLEDSEDFSRDIFHNSLAAQVVWMGEEMIISMANDAMLSIWGRDASVIGKPWIEAIPELVATPVMDRLRHVYYTGEPYYQPEEQFKLIRYGQPYIGYYNYTYKALRNGAGEIYGVISTAIEVTEQVVARKKAEESKHRFRTLIDASPIRTILLTGPDMIVELANEPVLQSWSKDRSILGKPLLEILPELAGQPFPKLLDEVYTTGRPYIANKAPATWMRDGKPVVHYFDFNYQPMFTSEGEVYGVLSTAVDVTERVLAQQALEESEKYFRDLTDTVPAIIWITNPDGFCTYLNRNWYAYSGQTQEEAEGFGWLNATHPDDKAKTAELFLKANANQSTFNALYRLRTHNGEYRWAIDTGSPKFSADGKYEGMIGTVLDVHDQITAQEEIKRSEERFRSLIKAAPMAIGLFVGRDLIIEEPNQTFINIVGKGDSIIGGPLRDAMPELLTEGQPFLKILDDVYTKGEMFQTFGTQVKIVQNGVLTYNYYDFTYTPLFDEKGEVYAILDIAIDVTPQVLAQQAIQKSEQNLRNMVLQAPVAICILRGPNYVVEIANERMYEVWGSSGEDFVNKPIFEALPEVVGQGFEEFLNKVYTTGEAFTGYGVPLSLPKNGKTELAYVNFVYEAFRDMDGSISGIIAVITDVTEQILARQKIEAAEAEVRNTAEQLQFALNAGKLGSYELILATGEINCTAQYKRNFGLQEDEVIDFNRLITLILPEDSDYKQQAMKEAIDNHHNYTSEYRIHLPDKSIRWIRSSGNPVYDENNTPIKMVGVTLDITEQKIFAEQLSIQVQERTEELAAANEELFESNRQLVHSNEELAQYAYVASHDLQEPLRKIRMFSGMLESKSNLAEDHKVLVDKINQSSQRMTLLIQDLLAFSRLLKSDTLMRPVDLAEVTAAVTDDFELAIVEKEAIVEIGPLPVIEAVALQMNQLFYNLLSNALKFTEPDQVPHISIQAQAISIQEARRYIQKPFPFSKYYRITFADNGIGFETKYSEQIFEVFKRLQGRDLYPGSGIGLALCRRIVANHNGHLYVASAVGRGSSFYIIIPDRQHDYQSELPENFNWNDLN